ncbi:hypothetical protein C1O66_12665 [Paucibacter aquatile]|uniref:Uncharacterized protein n=1 Tax=Kinneretia aquatilis TaxID=2070761 RepID=A0A2N8KXU0_9BURK|nr:hypothetical protein C1O66_12665 [Paucibacter aquatile]
MNRKPAQAELCNRSAPPSFGSDREPLAQGRQAVKEDNRALDSPWSDGHPASIASWRRQAAP